MTVPVCDILYVFDDCKACNSDRPTSRNMPPVMIIHGPWVYLLGGHYLDKYVEPTAEEGILLSPNEYTLDPTMSPPTRFPGYKLRLDAVQTV